MNKPQQKLEQYNVIYNFICPKEACSASYIGMTSTTLKNRLYAHKYSGSIKNHYLNIYNETIDHSILYNNTKICYNMQNRNMLPLMEAVLIKRSFP